MEAILGDVCDPRGNRLARISAAQGATAHADGSARCRPHARDRLCELALPVAGDTCDGDDLARTQREGDIVQGGRAAVAVRAHVLQDEGRIAGSAAVVLAPSELDLAADHHRRE